LTTALVAGSLAEKEVTNPLSKVIDLLKDLTRAIVILEREMVLTARMYGNVPSSAF